MTLVGRSLAPHAPLPESARASLRDRHAEGPAPPPTLARALPVPRPLVLPAARWGARIRRRCPSRSPAAGESTCKAACQPSSALPFSPKLPTLPVVAVGIGSADNRGKTRNDAQHTGDAEEEETNGKDVCNDYSSRSRLPPGPTVGWGANGERPRAVKHERHFDHCRWCWQSDVPPQTRQNCA